MGGGMMKDVITPPHTQHLYPYRWSLEDAVFTKDKGKVFSCFACGGGSTMGYKIAGYDVIGYLNYKSNEIRRISSPMVSGSSRCNIGTSIHGRIRP